jgi:hypothetical protein
LALSFPAVPGRHHTGTSKLRTHKCIAFVV